MAEKLAVASSWTPEEKVTFLGLHTGTRDEGDTISWRSLIIKSRALLGSKTNPDNEPANVTDEIFIPFAQALLGDTWLEPLLPEFEQDVRGFHTNKDESIPTRSVLFNGRHLPESLLYRLAEQMKGSVAVANPVGHYPDGETRILGPMFLGEVDRLVLLASTQAQLGGSYEVLAKVCRLARLKGIGDKIINLDVVIPMAGGSRGHRLGQDFGAEVLEAVSNPKGLSLLMKNILKEVKREFGVDIKVRFYSVDLHNVKSFKNVFNKSKFEFVNIDPSQELAEGLFAINKLHIKTENEKMIDRFFACDEGAAERTGKLVEAYMQLAKKQKFKLDPVEVVFLKKKRVGGVVKKVWIDRVESWTIDGNGKIKRNSVAKPTLKSKDLRKCRGHFCDDMGDTLGTLKKDNTWVKRYYPTMTWSDAALTHAVLSKGHQVLKKAGLNHYVFTNTLRHDGLKGREDVTIVDVAPAIHRAISGTIAT